MADKHGDFVLEWLQRARQQQVAKKSEVPPASTAQLKAATWTLFVFQVMLIILFGVVGGTSQVPADNSIPLGTAGHFLIGSPTQAYNMYIGVEIMMFIGFGYLMTFLKWYGLGAVGFSMVLIAVAIQWDLFTEHFWYQMFFHTLHGHWTNVPMHMYALLDTLYAVAAVLISFGAIIGKASPLQLVIMVLIEICCHSFNYEVLMSGTMHIEDIGGTYIDHMFGAYFGLSVAFILGKPKFEPEFAYTSDLFSMIGTLFLWIYWPSFVIGAAPADSEQQEYGMVNTILALSASTVCAFFVSSLFDANGRFRPVDVQNATLAGGVAIGCTANLTMSGFGAIMIGCTAGIVSAVGYNHIMPWMENTVGIHDTCGIHNLHGMPSVIGALASVILAGYKGYGPEHREHDHALYGSTVHSQWWRQWVAIFLCMATAIVTGLCTGLIMKAACPEGHDKPFQDEIYWTVADDYGRSLYSELTNILGDAESEVKDAMANAMPEFSSHAGRRKVTDKPMIMGALPQAIENSQHGKREHAPVNKESQAIARSALDGDENA